MIITKYLVTITAIDEDAAREELARALEDVRECGWIEVFDIENLD